MAIHLSQGLTRQESLEYQKYLDSHGSIDHPIFNAQEYRTYLHQTQSLIAHIIFFDANDQISDLGRRILKHSDSQTRLALARSCKGFYERCRKDFFTDNFERIIVRYIQRNTSYAHYVKDEGVSVLGSLLCKVGIVVVTIFSFKKYSDHRKKIPPDAPKKKDECGREYIDHPEAYKASKYMFACSFTGVCGGYGMFLHRLFQEKKLEDFLNLSQKDFAMEIASEHTLSRVFSPDYYRWKIEKMKDNLVSNPPNWKSHPQLSQLVCPLSQDFMLFPVQDKCGHRYDYRSIRAYQLDSNNHYPLKCPISGERFAFSRLKFDMTLFCSIYVMLNDLNYTS